MSTGVRKRSGKKKKTTAGSPTVLTLVIILVTVLALAMFYFFYFDQKPKEKTTTSKPALVTPAKKPAPVSQNFLDGTWVSSNDGRILEIHGNRFSLELPSVSDHKITKGTLRISGNTVTIRYTGTQDKCSSQAGIYTLHKEGKSIRFSVKKDVCAGRKQIFSASWEKF